MEFQLLVALAALTGLSTGFALGAFLERGLSARLRDRDMERLTNLYTLGSPEPRAQRFARSPSAESRAIETVKNARIANATAVIIAKYQEKGIPITDEEARLQAEAMLAGRSPVVLAE